MLPLTLTPQSKRLTSRLRSERLPSALNLIASHYFDRARSLPADRVQPEEMVEHHGIAPCIPAWKVLADGHHCVSLNTYARDINLESRAGVAPA